MDWEVGLLLTGMIQWEVGLLLIGVLFIIFAVFSLGRSRKHRKHENPGITAREQIERTRQRQGVRDDMQSLMVEIEQLAKRLGAQLDAKTVHIEKTLREADERIAQLQALHETAPSPAPGSTPGNSRKHQHFKRSSSAPPANEPARG